jgi:hypothetical protein
MKKTWRLKPMKTPIGGRIDIKYFDQVMIYDGACPFAIVHTDMFWEGFSGGNHIYGTLYRGGELDVDVLIEQRKEHQIPVRSDLDEYFPVRIQNALRRAGVQTLASLIEIVMEHKLRYDSYYDYYWTLIPVRMFGKKSWDAVLKAFDDVGFDWKKHIKDEDN